MQALDDGGGQFALIHEYGFGDFQGNGGRADAGRAESVPDGVDEAQVLELAHGDVNGDREVLGAGQGIAPLLGLLERLVEDPAANWNDQAAVFGEADEV